MPDRPDLTDLTVDWVSALLDSADVDTIGAKNWWDRATSALETAAAGADNAAHAATIGARKLQITTLSEKSALAITDLTARLDAQWPEWIEKVAAESVYIIALVRVTRTERRRTNKTAKKPDPIVLTDDAAPMF